VTDMQVGRVEFGASKPNPVLAPDDRIAVLEYRVALLTDGLLALMKAHGALLQSLQLACAQPNGAPN